MAHHIPKIKASLGLLCLAFLLTACATIYTAPDFGTYKADHEKVAIIPFDVTINPGNKSKDVSAEELEKLETEQGEIFQRAVYTQFLQGQQRGR